MHDSFVKYWDQIIRFSQLGMEGSFLGILGFVFNFNRIEFWHVFDGYQQNLPSDFRIDLVI